MHNKVNTRTKDPTCNIKTIHRNLELLSQLVKILGNNTKIMSSNPYRTTGGFPSRYLQDPLELVGQSPDTQCCPRKKTTYRTAKLLIAIYFRQGRMEHCGLGVLGHPPIQKNYQYFYVKTKNCMWTPLILDFFFTYQYNFIPGHP